MEDLRAVSFFENFGDEEFKLLSSIAKKKSFTKDSIIFYEKDIPTSLIILVEGLLKVYKTDPKNNEVIMHRFMPVHMIAEMAVLEGIPYPASAAFETDGTIIEINFEAFKKEFLHKPEMALMFFKSLSKKIKYLEDVIALNVVLDSTARLAKYLCDNSAEVRTLKHYYIAKNLHMTPETLSRTFKKLCVLGLVEKESNSYVIKNEEGLRVLFE